jgi:RNA polymerase II subunit A C-terminal domain phosphatase SSU72
MEIRDNHEEAAIAGKAILDLATAVSHLTTASYPNSKVLIYYFEIESATDIDEEMEEILEKQEQKHPHSLLHAVAYY